MHKKHDMNVCTKYYAYPDVLFIKHIYIIILVAHLFVCLFVSKLLRALGQINFIFLGKG